MEITVNVTELDIRDGKRCKCFSCPVALALKRLFPGYEITVGTKTVAVCLAGVTWIGNLPKKAATAIARIDAGEMLAPFQFKLRLA